MDNCFNEKKIGGYGKIFGRIERDDTDGFKRGGEIHSHVNVSDLRVGDTVFLNGGHHTVGRNDLKKDGFMPKTFRGDPFLGGILRVSFIVPTAFGFRVE